jgi:LacI family transcriptional regulator
MKPPRTVALLIESSRGYGRGLLRGIARYARARPNWSLLHEERGLADDAPDWLTSRPCDGIIARIESEALLRTIRRLRLPTVDVRALHVSAGIPAITVDQQITAQMAADHLLERGFSHVGFCGLAGVDYSTQRRDHFVAYLRRNGRAPLVYEGTAVPGARDTTQREARAAQYEGELRAWLIGLPKPVGIMACNDIRGRQVLSACRAAGLKVPDDVAVVGVDNDEVLCELADPPLSSVVPATDRIGYEAAALLERLMRGKPAPARPRFIAPLTVVTRRSSHVLAVADREVVTALRFIREHASDGINVEDVLDHLSASEHCSLVSRSTLDRRFGQLLGRSPKDEILRVRVARVRQLLLETDHTLAQIARLTGMEHTEYLNVLFKAQTGETPGTFRKRMGQRVPVGAPSASAR